MSTENSITITITERDELEKIVQKADHLLEAIDRSEDKGIQMLIKAYTPVLTKTESMWFGLFRTDSFLDQHGYTEVTEQAINHYWRLNWLADYVEGYRVPHSPRSIRNLAASERKHALHLKEYAMNGYITMPLTQYDSLMTVPLPDSGIFYDWNRWPDDFFQKDAK